MRFLYDLLRCGLFILRLSWMIRSKGTKIHTRLHRKVFLHRNNSFKALQNFLYQDYTIHIPFFSLKELSDFHNIFSRNCFANCELSIRVNLCFTLELLIIRNWKDLNLSLVRQRHFALVTQT